MASRLLALVAALAALALPRAAPAAALPRPAHVVVVIDENKTFAQIIGNPQAPYLNALARGGAVFTRARGVTHPSLPNYFALFAGITNDNGDGCPATGIDPTAPNVASELLAAHDTFAAYAESLPSPGFRGCYVDDTYARKHAPWVSFRNVPPQLQLPFRDFPTDLARLPVVAFVVPNVRDDMHSGSIAAGDAWVRDHLGRLIGWARTHDTLVVFTWDEGFDAVNSLPTFFVGPMVKPGRYAERVDHYRVLRTIEQMEGLRPTGRAANVAPIADVWR